MAKSIVLIGMMGCGKTTVGKLLAQHFGCTLVDTDAMIEEHSQGGWSMTLWRFGPVSWGY